MRIAVLTPLILLLVAGTSFAVTETIHTVCLFNGDSAGDGTVLLREEGPKIELQETLHAVVNAISLDVSAHFWFDTLSTIPDSLSMTIVDSRMQIRHRYVFNRNIGTRMTYRLTGELEDSTDFSVNENTRILAPFLASTGIYLARHALLKAPAVDSSFTFDPMTLRSGAARWTKNNQIDGSFGGKTETATEWSVRGPGQLDRYRLLSGSGTWLSTLFDGGTQETRRQDWRDQRYNYGPKDSGIEEREVSFGQPPRQAKLTLPKARSKPVPLVILVGDDGKIDADGTTLARQPYRLLAEKLATHGIAVLRWPTPWFRDTINVFDTIRTWREFFADDPLAALEWAGSQKEINPKRVYLLGHGLAGRFAPYVAQQGGAWAGTILLNSPAMGIDSIALAWGMHPDLIQYFDPGDLPDRIGFLTSTAEVIQRGSFGNKFEFLGRSGTFWNSVAKYDALSDFSKLKIPVMLAQGEFDLTTHTGNLALWAETARKAKLNCGVLLLPEMDHYLSHTTLLQADANYLALPIDPDVVTAISDFVWEPEKFIHEHPVNR